MEENIISACLAVAASMDKLFLSLLISKGCYTTIDVIPQTTPTVFQFASERTMQVLSKLFYLSFKLKSYLLLSKQTARKHGSRKQTSVLQ